VRQVFGGSFIDAVIADKTADEEGSASEVEPEGERFVAEKVN
jgi:hypothetical protein